jgi:hypothetical protein
LKDADRIEQVLGADYHVSPEAAREAVLHRNSFNAIHQRSLTKVDFMIRKDGEYRRHEFTRRVRVEDFEVWVVGKEDRILSKLDWARESHSQRQLSDVENLIATGFSVKDTAPEVNALLFRRMMSREPGERLRMGLDMTATAKALVRASLPGRLGEAERRRAFLDQFYGEV